MLGGIRSRLTYANVMATVAVFIALGGGAYAVTKLDRNSVKSKHIVNGQVKPKDLSAPKGAQSAGLPVDEGGELRRAPEPVGDQRFFRASGLRP